MLGNTRQQPAQNIVFFDDIWSQALFSRRFEYLFAGYHVYSSKGRFMRNLQRVSILPLSDPDGSSLLMPAEI